MAEPFWVIECNGSYYTGNGTYDTTDPYYASRFSSEYQGFQARDALNGQGYCGGNNRLLKITYEFFSVSDDEKVEKVPFSISKFSTELIETEEVPKPTNYS